jgi:hypothetical protein
LEFWTLLMKKVRTKLKINNVFHPQNQWTSWESEWDVESISL